jgi:TonB family protein
VKRRPRPRLLAVRGPARPGSQSEAIFVASRGLPARARGRIAIAGALAAYGGLAAWAMVATAHRPAAAAAPPEIAVELYEPPPPPPPPPPDPPEPPRPRARTIRAAPAPARAAQVVAQAPAAEEPLDLTSFTIATGAASSYAGGATSTTGTSTTAGDGSGTAADGDLSQPVRLREDEWDCPWPAEADALGIDEQTVVLQVTVSTEGRVTAAGLTRDPGYGFGDTALACARRTRFEAARDRGGRRVAARSGPIRVRFFR